MHISVYLLENLLHTCNVHCEWVHSKLMAFLSWAHRQSIILFLTPHNGHYANVVCVYGTIYNSSNHDLHSTKLAFLHLQHFSFGRCFVCHPQWNFAESERHFHFHSSERVHNLQKQISVNNLLWWCIRFFRVLFKSF